MICDGVPRNSAGAFPNTSLFETAKNIDQNQLLIGKSRVAEDTFAVAQWNRGGGLLLGRRNV